MTHRNEAHEETVRDLFLKLIKVFGLKGYKFRLMRRVVDEEGKGVLNIKKGYNEAYINLRTKVITIDIYTPKFRKSKSIRLIMCVLAHEIAHIQKPPYRQRYRGRIITRQHYPTFYEQVNKNYAKIEKYI